jgi:hypothetical protein
MTLTNDYLIIEKLAGIVRTACPAARVYDSTPTVLNSHELEALFRVTFEGARLLYAWIVTQTGVASQPHGTNSQREAVGATIYGYMIHGDRPGIPDTDDPGVGQPFASGTATGGSTLTVQDSAAAWAVNAYANTHEAWSTYADGTLDHARILSNTATALTLRTALTGAVVAGATYQIYLRPTEHIIHEQARALIASLSTNRSNLATAITGNLGSYKLEPVIWYGYGMWRVSIDINRDLFPAKAFA